MMKRISRDPAEQTPFERFYLEWPKLLEDAGGVLRGFGIALGMEDPDDLF